MIQIQTTLRPEDLQTKIERLWEVSAPKILAILEAMHAFYGEPRYRPSPWLKRRAKLGISLLTPE